MRGKQVIQNYFSVPTYVMPCVRYRVFRCEQNRVYPVLMEFRDMERKKFLVLFFLSVSIERRVNVRRKSSNFCDLRKNEHY